MANELMYVGDDPEIIGGDDEIIGTDEFAGDEDAALAEILGADPRRGNRARQRPGPGQVMVRQRKADSVYLEWLPIPTTTIAAGATADVEPKAVRTFRLEQIQIFGGEDLSITSFLVDQDSVFAGPGEVPAGLLGADSRLRLKSRTVGRGSSIVLSVKNFGSGSVTLRGVLSGTVLR